MIALLLTIACDRTTPEADTPTDPDAADGSADIAEVPMAPAEPGYLTEAAFSALHDLKDEAAPPAKGEMVEVGGMAAYLSLPEGATGPLPTVIVIHEWWGLNTHIKHWTDRLAAHGYAALAVDLYDGKIATDHTEALELMKGVDEAEALAKLVAAHAFATSDPRISAPKVASVGWCFGGGWSLQLAMAEPDLDGAVIYYGRLVDDRGALAAIEAPLLGIFAKEDAGIPVDAVQQFQATLGELDKTVDVHLYDAGHAFANPSGGRYDAVSADAAWDKTRTFLASVLAP